MSNRRRPQSNEPASQRHRGKGSDGDGPLVARGAEDVLSVVPYLLGFHPSDSLVVLSLHGARRRVGFRLRVDLPEQPAQARALGRQLLPLLRRNGATTVLLIAYAADDHVAGPVMAVVLEQLRAAGIDVADAWRADGSRWWSCLCSDRRCCPPDGTPYDASAAVCAAEAVLRGLVALPDRATLQQSVAAVTGRALVEMQQATERAEAEILPGLFAAPGISGTRSVRRAQERVVAAVTSFVSRPRQLSDAEVARLSVWLRHVHVRDAAWCTLDPAHPDPHVDLWRQVTRRAVRGHVAAPASLLSFAAWVAGNGALAQCALERALADDPGYSMAALIRETLACGLPPSAWTPLPLAKLYAATG
jgi:Domain of unknown function (DUF4192)